MSLAKKAVRGAAWLMISSISSRLIGVVGTLMLTHLLAPAVVGEVAVAQALVQSVRLLSTIGFGQYIVATPNLGRPGIFHVTFYNLMFAVVGFAALLVVAEPVAPLFNNPGMTAFIPGLVLAGLIDRVGLIPEKILVRDLHFKARSITRAISEVSYAACAVALARAGWGGEAIVAGTILRSVILTAVFMLMVDKREWLTPSALDREHTAAMFRFGAPLWVSLNAALAARTWDNLLFSSYFGATRMGHYNLAYNLANIPSINVGEHIADVLLPSFARLKAEERKTALVRSNALLGLLIFPMAVGLGAVSESLVAILFNEEWQPVAPYLLILSVLSLVQPISYSVHSYLEARHLTRVLMYIGIQKIILLLGLMALLGLVSDIWACIGVGIAFAINTLTSFVFIWRIDGISVGRMCRGMAGPLLSCVPLVAAVYGVRALQLDNRIVGLVGEIFAGGAAYVASSLLVSRTVVKDFLHLLRKNLLGRG